MQVQIAGMAWFEEDDYEAFRTVLPDRSWHPSFRQWQQAAEANIKQFEKRGMRVVRARVRSADFKAWCAASGRNVNTAALTEFANEFAARVLFDEQSH